MFIKAFLSKRHTFTREMCHIVIIIDYNQLYLRPSHRPSCRIVLFCFIQ